MDINDLSENLNNPVYVLNSFYKHDYNRQENYKKYKKIIKFLKNHKDNANIYGYLAFIYTTATIYKTNIKKATKYAKIGKKLNNALSFTILGDIYHFGWGVTKNINKAIIYYNKGSKLNCPSSKTSLAIIYMDKEIGYRNVTTAKKLLYQAIKLGFNDAYCTLSSVCLLEGNIKKYFKCCTLLIINNNLCGYYLMAIHFDNNNNIKKAIKYYKKCEYLSFPKLIDVYDSIGDYKKASKLRSKHM